MSGGPNLNLSSYIHISYARRILRSVITGERARENCFPGFLIDRMQRTEESVVASDEETKYFRFLCPREIEQLSPKYFPSSSVLARERQSHTIIEIVAHLIHFTSLSMGLDLSLSPFD